MLCICWLTAVEPLVVSAGDNHTIQLPTDSITLYAFVLDDNSSGAFSLHFQQEIICCLYFCSLELSTRGIQDPVSAAISKLNFLQGVSR